MFHFLDHFFSLEMPERKLHENVLWVETGESELSLSRMEIEPVIGDGDIEDIVKNVWNSLLSIVKDNEISQKGFLPHDDGYVWQTL